MASLPQEQFRTASSADQVSVTILSVDPGPDHSALVLFDGARVIKKEILPNALAKSVIETSAASDVVRYLAIEKITNYGSVVGSEVFETVYWSGRFAEVWSRYRKEEPIRIPRTEIKVHLCGTARAKDAGVMAALMDRFGGKTKAKGTKQNPGPLYGVSTHCWAALAVGAVAYDRWRMGEFS